MTKSRPVRILVVVTTGCFASGVLAFAGVSLRDRIFEEWYLSKLDRGIASERQQAINGLIRVGSSRCIDRAVLLLKDGSLDSFQFLHLVGSIKSRGMLTSTATRVVERATNSSLIETQLRKVDSREKLCLLSVGRDQGVRRGDVFVVLRSSQAVAEINVIKVYPELCGAQIRELTGGLHLSVDDRCVGFASQSATEDSPEHSILSP